MPAMAQETTSQTEHEILRTLRRESTRGYFELKFIEREMGLRTCMCITVVIIRYQASAPEEK